MPCLFRPDTPEEYELPALEAVLAGTLALMTGHAQASCALQRRRLAQRIVDNMELLGEHPQLSGTFRRALARLRAHWELLREGRVDGEREATLLRHPAAARVQ